MVELLSYRVLSALTLFMLGLGAWTLSQLVEAPKTLSLTSLIIGALGCFLCLANVQLRFPLTRRALVDVCGCVIPLAVSILLAVNALTPLYFLASVATYAASYALCTRLDSSAVVLRYLEPSVASTLILAYAIPRRELPSLVLSSTLATILYVDIVSYVAHYRRVLPPTKRFVVGGAQGLDAIVLTSLTVCGLCIAIYILESVACVG